MCNYYGTKCDPENCDADFCGGDKFDYAIGFVYFDCEYCDEHSDVCRHPDNIWINKVCSERICHILKE